MDRSSTLQISTEANERSSGEQKLAEKKTNFGRKIKTVYFDFLFYFLACLGLELRTFWTQSQQRRPMDKAAN
jgi:hypothetical protein